MDGVDIRIARWRSGIRQYELAARAGMRPAELSLIENGHKRVSAEKLIRLVRALEAAAEPQSDRAVA